MKSKKQNLHIIALETSGKIGSVAAGIDGQLLIEKEFSGNLRHTAELLPTIDDICQKLKWAPQDIDQLHISAGPGSFTGIRLVITLAKTMGFALGIRIVPVPSIEGQFFNAKRAAQELGITIDNVAVVLEAGRGQIFTAAAQCQAPKIDNTAANSPEMDSQPTTQSAFIPGFKIIIPDSTITCAELLSQSPRPLHLLGEGINYHRRELEDQPGVSILPETYWMPRAANILKCGWLRAQADRFASNENTPSNSRNLKPIYMRRPEAVEKWEELHGPDKPTK